MTDEETKKKISQLQQYEQNIQALLSQKQQFQQKLMEISSALEELDKSKTAYKIIGNIMVMREKKDLVEDLTSKKEIVEIRIKNLEKQESQIREKAKVLQNEIVGKL